MRILVLSDSHGDSRAILRVLERCDGRADMCVFLGDGIGDAEYALSRFPALPRVIVRGNCDEFFPSATEYPREMKFDADGTVFLAMHGHRPHDVKGGVGAAALYAAKNGASVLLFGHTHRKEDRTVETANGAVRVINPGSVGRGSERSFAMLETVGGQVVCGFGEV